METLGMSVTAEPYFAVTQPGNVVVLENTVPVTGGGKVENIDATYELLGRGVYSSSNTKIENAIFGIDPKTPRELCEARNAVRIARNASGGKDAPTTLSHAEKHFTTAADAYPPKPHKKTGGATPPDGVQNAEKGCVSAVKQKGE